jgi:hypothetical protein
MVVKPMTPASLTFAEILGRKIDASGKSHGQIGRESGVPDALIGMYRRARPARADVTQRTAALCGSSRTCPLDRGRIGGRRYASVATFRAQSVGPAPSPSPHAVRAEQTVRPETNNQPSRSADRAERFHVMFDQQRARVTPAKLRGSVAVDEIARRLSAAAVQRRADRAHRPAMPEQIISLLP